MDFDTKGRKIVGYTRYSSENQKEDSIEVQKSIIEEYAEDNDLHVDYYYEDKAISGTTDIRPGYQKLICDIKNDEIALVLFSAADRLGRNHYNDMQFYKIAEEHDTVLCFADDELATNKDKLKVMSASIQAQRYSEKLGKRIKKKAEYSVSKGHHPGGRAPIGYKIDTDVMGNRKLVIDNSRSLIVNNIFDMFLHGFSISQIVDECNNRHWKTLNGTGFCKDSITGILRNDVYIGNLSYGKTTGKRLDGKRNSRKKNSPDRVIVFEGAHTPLVSQSDWDQVQKMLDSHEHYETENKRFYLMRNLLRCKVCKQGMSGELEKSHENSYRIYKCNNAINHRACQNSRKKVKADLVEKAVCDHIADYFLSPAILSILVKLVNKHFQESANLHENMRIKKAMLENYKKQKRGLLELTKSLGAVDNDIVEEVKDCIVKIQVLEEEIDTLNTQMKTPAVSEADVRSQLENLHEVLMNPSILSSLKIEFMHHFIQKIELDGDSFEVFYKNLPIVK